MINVLLATSQQSHEGVVIMWIQEPGKVGDRIDFIGTRKNCLYLLKGEDAMIIGGGMSWTAPSLERQFSAMDFDLKKIRYLVVPHSHFDHCGAVPYLKRKFPQVQIIASAYSQKVFSTEKAVNFIANVNWNMIEKLALQDEYERLNLQFDGIKVDRVVTENDAVALGDGIEAQFMEVPGHSRCCIAVYIPKLKAIFPSDAAPWPTDDGSELFPSPNDDFYLYRKSLEKLAAHKVEICGFDHHGAFVGDQAKNILQQGLEQTEKLKAYIIEQYQAMGDLDKTAEKFASEALGKMKFPFLSHELMTTISKVMIRSIIG
jgi:glyoxylase-like metal-dependent hydrolase (beta-lactamase superfamily II)